MTAALAIAAAAGWAAAVWQFARARRAEYAARVAGEVIERIRPRRVRLDRGAAGTPGPHFPRLG